MPSSTVELGMSLIAAGPNRASTHTHRSDRVTAILVTKIIDLCTAGESDPDRLCQLVVAYFRAEPTARLDA